MIADTGAMLADLMLSLSVTHERSEVIFFFWYYSLRQDTDCHPMQNGLQTTLLCSGVTGATPKQTDLQRSTSAKSGCQSRQDSS